jgi:hypothetical protein
MLTCATSEDELARLGCRILLALLDGPGYPSRFATRLVLAGCADPAVAGGS